MSNEYEEFMNSNKNEDSSSAEEIDEVEIDTIDVEVVGVSIPFIDIFVLVFKYVIAFFLVSVCIAIIGFFITALLGISALSFIYLRNSTQLLLIEPTLIGR